MTSAIVTEVEKFVGYKYVYGAAGPTDFDCSGLVQYVLDQLGYKNVPRTSEEQYSWATKISASQLQPGDLVFAQFPGDNASPGHVGIYTGNGQVLSAQDPAQGVGYASLASWGSAIVGYGRVPGAPGTSASAPASTTGGSSGTLADLTSWLTGIPTEFSDMFTLFHNLVSPAWWLRVVAGIGGVLLLGVGIYVLAKANTDSGLMPQSLPVPVPI
jgi:NlpC/P60 family protein